MSERRKGKAGSRYLYEPFSCRPTDCAPSHRIEANERVANARWEALEYRLGVMNALLTRLESRLWLALAGVASAVLANGVQTLMSAQ